MTGAFAIRRAGSQSIGSTGARRLGWMHSERTVPLFAVMFVQGVPDSYYAPGLDPRGPHNIEGRTRWKNDVATYELLAAQMTEPRYPGGPPRNLWPRVNMLLVHVESFGRDQPLLPIWPPELSEDVPPYPSHINAADVVVMPWRPEPEIFRLTLEQRGSSVYPRWIFIDAADNWYPGHLWPGFQHWIDNSPVPIDVRAIRGAQWVDWMIQILRRVLGV